MKGIWIYGCILGLLACTSPQPENLVGVWAVDKLMVDGMDKTDQYHNFPWGTGIEFMENGYFRTNSRKEVYGKWKMQSHRSALYLDFLAGNAPYNQWKVFAGKDYLALKTTSQQIYLYKTDALPKLPSPTINLRNNLPGTWFFYQMTTDSTIVKYPQSKQWARWVKIENDGYYQSGEGNTLLFRGRWALNYDTLTFSELDRAWKKSWQISMDHTGEMYFHTLPGDTVDWQEVSFINEKNLP